MVFLTNDARVHGESAPGVRSGDTVRCDSVAAGSGAHPTGLAAPWDPPVRPARRVPTPAGSLLPPQQRSPSGLRGTLPCSGVISVTEVLTPRRFETSAHIRPSPWFSRSAVLFSSPRVFREGSQLLISMTAFFMSSDERIVFLSLSVPPQCLAPCPCSTFPVIHVIYNPYPANSNSESP